MKNAISQGRRAMTEPRRFEAGDALLFLFILAVAFAVRAGFLLTFTSPQRPSGWLQVQDPSPPVPDKKDATELSELWHNFKDDKGFACRAPFADKEELTAHTSPGYPLLLGALGRLFDDATLETLVRWLQAVLGTLTAGWYFLFARRAFHSLFVAALAGLFCAAHPFWVLDTGTLEDGTLASFLLALGIFLGARGIQTGGPLSSLLYGLTMAALAMVRAACLPFAFVAVAWYLLRSRSVTRGWLCALLAFLGFVNGLVPWTVRNFQVFNEPVPIVDSAYYHLWIGNNPEATGGPVTAVAVKNAIDQEQRENPDRKLADMSQPERYAQLGRMVRDYWRENSLRAVQLRVWAALDFWMGERWFKTGELASEAPPAVVKKDEDNSEQTVTMPSIWQRSYPGILHGALLGMFVLAALGWRWSYGWRREAMPLSLAVIWIPLPYILSHAESLSGPRLPLDGVLLCYAAFAVGCFVPGVAGHLFAGGKESRLDF
jgi:hypothetical protein